MTNEEIGKLKHLTADEIPQWQFTDYEITKRLDAAIPYIGAIRITSTYRTPGSSAATMSFHSYIPALAIDFVPLETPLWTVFSILQQLGFHRIGIRPDANMIHIDNGYQVGKAYEYYFLENNQGTDIGPLASQPLERLQLIPGFNDSLPIIQKYTVLSKINVSTFMLAMIPAGIYFIKKLLRR